MDEEDLAALMEEQDELEKEEEEKVLAAARDELVHGQGPLDDQREYVSLIFSPLVCYLHCCSFVSSAQEAISSGSSLGARLLQKMGKLPEPGTSHSLGASDVQPTPYISEGDKHRSSLRDKKDHARGLGYIPEKAPKEKIATKAATVKQGPRLAGTQLVSEVNIDSSSFCSRIRFGCAQRR